MDLLNTLVEKGLRRELPTREEALAVLATSDDDLLEVVAAAGKVRRQWFGRRVKLNYLVNLKSGLCPEDCSYCSQRLGSTAEILKYTWLKPEEASKAAAAGVAGGAKRVCLVASGRGPTDRDVDRVSRTIEAIKEQNEDVEVCACLGLLSNGQAERLRARGPTRTTTTSTRPRARTGTSPPPTPTPTGWTRCARRSRPVSPPARV